MKKVYVLFLMFIALGAKAQWVSIPDSSFRVWLNANGYAACMSGTLLDTTCNAVTSAITVKCISQNIKSIQGIQYFDNLDTLIFENNRVDSVSVWPRGIVMVDCRNNRLTKMAAFPNTLTRLRCSNNIMRSLPSMPNSLLYLDCTDNNLSSGLPDLSNTSLEDLYCIWDSLPVLPNLPPTIRNVYCYGNDITVINNLPNGLEYISCYDNKITNVQSLPASLQVFIAAQNQISSLPPLPSGLRELSVANNLLTALPSLPATIGRLYCSNNFLTSLPALPGALWDLFCDHNQLTSLPTFNSSFNYNSWLKCQNNQLTSLPTLPIYLGALDCSNNQLTSLPALPQNMISFYLNCSNNLLTDLPPIPAVMSSLLCDSNLTLTCLPHIRKITTLNFSNTAVQCIPNYGTVTTSTPLLSSLPLCSQSNPDNCTIYENITGKTYFDLFNNCTVDSSLPNMKLLLSKGGNVIAQSFSGGEGLYSFNADTIGVYQTIVDTTGLPFFISCPLSNMLLDTISVAAPYAYNKNFGLQCDGFDIVAWSIVSVQGFRPAQETTVKSSIGDMANFYGVSCVNWVNGTVTITINGPASYVAPANGALTPVANGNVLTYNINDFGAVNFTSDFNIIVQTDTTAALGSQVCITIAVSPTWVDNNPANNTLTHCFTVVGSFDPNDKQVYPEGDIDPAQEWLTYTIRFQNTGTAEAQHIYIADTLDSDLDVSSFRLLAYSHQPSVQLRENAVRFNFPNINLPDSNTNEPMSHGYVQYKIKLKDNLAPGTQINNTAFIYFDFNAAVVTNTTMNAIPVISSASSMRNLNSAIRIYPNPANNELNIDLNGLQADQVRLYSIDGKLVSEARGPRNNSIDISHLAKGVYMAEVKVGAETARVRWVKM